MMRFNQWMQNNRPKRLGIIAGRVSSWVLVGLLFTNIAYGGDDDWTALGNEEAKQQIEQLSGANRALFVEDNLANITKPSRLLYRFVHQSQYDKGYQGAVIVNIKKIDPQTNEKNLTFRYLSGRNRVRFPPQIKMRSNPLFMLFLEQDSRDMEKITGGNALFFRTRVRHAMAMADAISVEFNWQGKKILGKKIEIAPFSQSGLANRFERWQDKTYSFLLSDQIPGGFYQIRSRAEYEGKLIVQNTLTYDRIEDYSKDASL